MSKNYGCFSLAYLSCNPPSRCAKQSRENCFAKYKSCVMLPTVLPDKYSICTVSNTLISKVFSLSRTFICHIRCLNSHVWNKDISTSIFPLSSRVILYDPCKCWTKPHAYHSQGILGNTPPKGDSCILCGNVKTAAEGVGVRRAFSAKTFPKAPAEAGRFCPTSSTAGITPCSADSGLGLFSSSLSPGWCNHTVFSNHFNHMPFTGEMHAT